MLGIDIRIQTTVFQNPKVKRLQARLGAEGVLSLFRLWCYAGINRPDGILRDIAFEEIEPLVVDWTGTPGAFLAALRELRLVDDRDGIPAIHDWEENQPWAVGSNYRTEKAAKAAAARWGKAKNSPERQNKESNNDGTSMLGACNEHATSNATSMLVAMPGAVRSGTERYKNKPPLPPCQGGDTEKGAAPPPEDRDDPFAPFEPDPFPTSDGEAESESSALDAEPEPMPDPPKPAKTRDVALDRHAVTLVENYQAKVKTAHRCSRKQAIRNARTALVAMRTDPEHADCPDDAARAARLADAAHRYAMATAATDPTYRKHAANFYGRDAVWQAYLTPDSGRPIAPATTGKPQAARKDPLREQADRCFKGYPGCEGKPGSREPACQVCRARAPRDPTKRMPDFTGSADRTERERRERDEAGEGERA